MKALQRAADGPACLGAYEHGRHTWNDLSSAYRAEIREALWVMQGKFCAYCGRAVPRKSGHIEHFVQKSRVPAVTFEWANLFWSCCDATTCGKHKDARVERGSYRDSDLVKPDTDDPSDYFAYVVTGEMQPSAGLPDPRRRRAEETIRVFNLNDPGGGLRARRRQAFRMCRERILYLQSLLTEEPTSGDWVELVDKEIDDFLDELLGTEFEASTSALVAEALGRA